MKLWRACLCCSSLRLPLASEKALRADLGPLCCPNPCLGTPLALLVVGAEWKLHVKSSSLFLAERFVSKTMSRSWKQSSLLPLQVSFLLAQAMLMLFPYECSWHLPKTIMRPSTSIPSWWNCWPGAVALVRWASVWHMVAAPNTEFWKWWNRSFLICAVTSTTPASFPTVYAL